MPCYQPVLRVFYRHYLSGKLYSIGIDYHGEPLDDLRHDYEGTFRLDHGCKDYYEKLVLTPCGKCIGCRTDKRREWTSRLILEDKDEQKKGYFGYFITLTYDDDHLPSDGCLVKKDFQDFMKRFRINFKRRFDVCDVRFFGCGEYGENFHRPHYHLISWIPLDIDDVKSVTQLSWNLGFVEVDYASVDRFAYVAGYVSKKLIDSDDIEAVDVDTGEVTKLTKEFLLMSRRPGIGSAYPISKIKETGKVYLNDGKKVSPPRYYKNKLTPQEKEDLRIRGSPVDICYSDFCASGKSWNEFMADQFETAVRRLQLNKFNSSKGKRRI